MNRLSVKLTLSFLAVVVVGVVIAALLSAQATGEQFRQYVVGSGMASQAAWVPTLEAYYGEHGGWAGVSDLLGRLGPGTGQSMGRNGAGMGGPNLAVVDASGTVVASRTGEMAGEKLPADVLAQGLTLAWAGQRVGTLLNLRPGVAVLDAQQQSFLQQFQRSLAFSALAGVALALVLGAAISQRLAAPLARLTGAATAIAGGDLQQQVPVSGNDEIGRLAVAFNRMAAHLAELETLRRNMVADVSHELRTPLTVIQGNLQAILDGIYPLNTQQIAGLYDETRLLTRLVDDLHELALADAGQLGLQRAPVDLVELSRTTVAHFLPGAEDAGVHITVEAEESVMELIGDRDRLAQVLGNLLANALRHTSAGGKIAVRVGQRNDRVQLQVADTGDGIGPDDLPYVFDRFYRADNSQVGNGRARGGAGLGLAIVRQLVVAHGGEIAVESRLGAGTTFTITLPAPAAQG